MYTATAPSSGAFVHCRRPAQPCPPADLSESHACFLSICPTRNKQGRFRSIGRSCARIIRRHGARPACTVARMLPDASQPPVTRCANQVEREAHGTAHLGNKQSQSAVRPFLRAPPCLCLRSISLHDHRQVRRRKLAAVPPSMVNPAIYNRFVWRNVHGHGSVSQNSYPLR